MRAASYSTISCTALWRFVMSITASEARKRLFPLIEEVNDDHSAVEITSKRGNAVLLSADDYAAWQETAYLFRSPANARRLLDAISAELGGDPDVVQRHSRTLQDFDLAGQILGHLGALLAAEDRLTAIKAIGMPELRSRLLHTGLT